MTRTKTIKTGGGGLGFGTVLFLVFLVLKLTNQIDWSWWWVTSPLWIPFAIMMAFLLFFGVVAVLAIIINNK